MLIDKRVEFLWLPRDNEVDDKTFVGPQRPSFNCLFIQEMCLDNNKTAALQYTDEWIYIYNKNAYYLLRSS